MARKTRKHPANFDEALKAMDDSYEALRDSLCDIAAGTQKKGLAGSTIRDFNMVYDDTRDRACQLNNMKKNDVNEIGRLAAKG